MLQIRLSDYLVEREKKSYLLQKQCYMKTYF